MVARGYSNHLLPHTNGCVYKGCVPTINPVAFDLPREFSVHVYNFHHSSSLEFGYQCTFSSPCRWVDGLTAAKYVHQRVLEQASALQLYSSAGERLYDRDSWFGTNYLPTANRVVGKRRRRTTGDSRQRSTLHFSFSSRACGRRQVADRCMSESPSERDDEDFVEIELPRDLSGQLSHAASPSPMQQDSPPHATSPVHIPAQLDVSSLPVERTLIHSTPGLPYLQTPLSSICGCHAFEIAPSRSFNFGEGDVVARQRETGSKCCTRCRLTCRIVVDLSNI